MLFRVNKILDSTGNDAVDKRIINFIIQESAQVFNISFDDILSKKRKDSIVECRHCILHLCILFTSMSTREIADYVYEQGLDRSTLSSSKKRSIDLINSDSSYKTKFDTIFNNINSFINNINLSLETRKIISTEIGREKIDNNFDNLTHILQKYSNSSRYEIKDKEIIFYLERLESYKEYKNRINQ